MRGAPKSQPGPCVSQESYTGDTIYGSVGDTLCSTGNVTCTWRITAADLTRGVARIDTVVDSLGPFRKAVGGAVEVLSISQCAQYPFSGVFYHGVYTSAGNQRFTPTWTDTVRSTIKNHCSFSVTAMGRRPTTPHLSGSPVRRLGWGAGAP